MTDVLVPPVHVQFATPIVYTYLDPYLSLSRTRLPLHPI